jgi:hypothetical protein
MPSYYGDFVLPSQYAFAADWPSAWGDAPANADLLLQSATSLVLEATNQAYYAVDTNTGLPIDTQILNALKQATLIQAAAWNAMGYNPLSGGVPTTRVVQSSKAGGTSDMFADAAAAAQAATDAVRNLVPDAVRVLRLNNLLIPNAWVFG